MRSEMRILCFLATLFICHHDAALAQRESKPGTPADNYNKQAESFILGRKPQRAIPLLNKAIALEPNVGVYWLNRSSAETDLHQDDKALLDVTRALELNPHLLNAYSTRAVIWTHKKKYKRAIIDLNRAIQIRPDIAKFYSNRSVAYHGLGDQKRAIADATTAIRLNPLDGNAYSNRAAAYSDSQMFKAAMNDCNKAVELGYSSADLYSNFCVAYYGLHQWEKSLAAADQALKMDPNNVSGHFNRAAAYICLGEYKKAIEDCNQAIRIDPTASIAYNNRGVAYSRLHNWHKAIDDGSMAIKYAPTAMNLVNRGVALDHLGRHREALADFEEALRIDPNFGSGYSWRSEIGLKLGNYEQAIQDFDAARHIASQDKTQNQPNVTTKQLDAAIAGFNKLIEARLATENVYYDRAVLYLAEGKSDLAVNDFRKYLELSKWRGTAPIHAVTLGTLAYKLSHKDQEAKKLLDEAAEKISSPQWTVEFLYLRFGLPPEQLIEKARSTELRTTAYCCIGLNQLSAGKIDEAKMSLQWIRDHGDPRVDEYAIAVATLNRLKVDK